MKKHKQIQRIAESEEEHDHDIVLVLGTNGPDDISTGGGPQHIIAGNGDDVVSAGGGPDVIEGGNGDDRLSGGGGPDTILGGNGNDILAGNQGPDTLTGGRGEDIFVYADHGDAPAHGEGEDEGGEHEGEDGHSGAHLETITDFKPGVDMFDFVQLGTVTGFSSAPAEYSAWAVQDGDNAILMIDTNGDVSGEHAAEMAILLLGVDATGLSADDFLF